LLDEYGGQRYGGIATPRRHPVVFLFTGSKGVDFGYEDKWDGDGVFHYFGEGQEGDMKLSGGNAAIRDHAGNEKELHLFERVDVGRVRYVGEVICSGYEWKVGKDKVGKDRKAIVFQLVQASGVEADNLEHSRTNATLHDLAAAADADPTEENAPKEGLRQGLCA
jgi:5-methylcytosine-specific restriction protein A